MLKGMASAPSGRTTCARRSTVAPKPGRPSTAANSASTSWAGSTMGSNPFFRQLPWKMSAKLGAISTRMPKSCSAHTACSRLEPQPKFSRASRIRAPA
jgi:hypothetical protein